MGHANEPRPKKPQIFQLTKNVMFIVFIDYNGIVYPEFLPKDQTVNKRNFQTENETFNGLKSYLVSY